LTEKVALFRLKDLLISQGKHSILIELHLLVLKLLVTQIMLVSFEKFDCICGPSETLIRQRLFFPVLDYRAQVKHVDYWTANWVNYLLVILNLH